MSTKDSELHDYGLASLPGRVQVLESTFASQRSKLASQESRIVSLTTRVASLMDDVQVLAMISEPYKLLRHGFIISYKRNKLHMRTESNEKYIIGGDFVSHRGDAKVDAELYRLTDGKARDDFLVFQSLYGCLPQIVWQISKQPLLPQELE